MNDAFYLICVCFSVEVEVRENTSQLWVWLLRPEDEEALAPFLKLPALFVQGALVPAKSAQHAKYEQKLVVSITDLCSDTYKGPPPLCLSISTVTRSGSKGKTASNAAEISRGY